MDIESIRALCDDKSMVMTQHVALRCHERRISVDEIKLAIMTGEIIEQYPDDYPYPSCLVLSILVAGKALHVVCGIGDNLLWIITAYWPNLEKWEPDFRTRREK